MNILEFKKERREKLIKKWERIQATMTGHLSGRKIWDVGGDDEEEASYVFVDESLTAFLDETIDLLATEMEKEINWLKGKYSDDVCPVCGRKCKTFLAIKGKETNV